MTVGRRRKRSDGARERRDSRGAAASGAVGQRGSCGRSRLVGRAREGTAAVAASSALLDAVLPLPELEGEGAAEPGADA